MQVEGLELEASSLRAGMVALEQRMQSERASFQGVQAVLLQEMEEVSGDGSACVQARCLKSR